MTETQSRRPRYNARSFEITLVLSDFEIRGTAISPSGAGATVLVNEADYDRLNNQSELWSGGKRLIARTALNELPASINSIFVKDMSYSLSVKLLDDRNWYQ
jgi:hypothetical protein